MSLFTVPYHHVSHEDKAVDLGGAEAESSLQVHDLPPWLSLLLPQLGQGKPLRLQVYTEESSRYAIVCFLSFHL